MKYTGVSYGKFDASQVLIYVVFLGIVLMVSLDHCKSHDCMIAFKPRKKCRSTLETSGFTPQFFHRVFIVDNTLTFVNARTLCREN